MYLDRGIVVVYYRRRTLTIHDGTGSSLRNDVACLRIDILALRNRYLGLGSRHSRSK